MLLIGRFSDRGGNVTAFGHIDFIPDFPVKLSTIAGIGETAKDFFVNTIDIIRGYRFGDSVVLDPLFLFTLYMDGKGIRNHRIALRINPLNAEIPVAPATVGVAKTGCIG